MKAVKIVAIVFATYVGLVVVVESLIGYFQPDMPGAVTLITADSDGQTSSRVLAGFRMNDSLYVAANHWPRSWYNRAVANPEIEIISNGERSPYTAVAVEGAERDRLAETYDLEFLIRFLTGFPPRRFLRLDPR
jgi:hypothetical protein